MHPQYTPRTTKRCPTCGETKDAAEFSKRIAARDGLDSQCLVCKRAAHKRWLDGRRETTDPAVLLRQRQQFVRVCACGCGQPTLFARHDCRVSGRVEGQPQEYIDKHHNRGEGHHAWRGGRYLTSDGYVVVYIVDLTTGATYSGQEHRIVMSKHLGRRLGPDEIVHHIDGDKTNNAIENLQLVDRAEHVRIHRPRLGTGK